MSWRSALIGGQRQRRWREAIALARAHRAGLRFRAAAEAYEQALHERPDQSAIRIQCGHMWKEAGFPDLAERHYLLALETRPQDADLALQLGHLYKRLGRAADAYQWYKRAGDLKPDWQEASDELAAVRTLMPPEPPDGVSIEDLATLVPQLAPQPLSDRPASLRDHIEISRLGRREPSLWGLRRTMRGVEAIRGYCISAAALNEVQIFIAGVLVHTEPLVAAEPAIADGYRKYVFNAWLSVAGCRRGLVPVDLRFIGEGVIRSFNDDIVIAPGVAESEYPDSNALVSADPTGATSIEDQIRSRPSMIRQARRDFFPDGLRNILVLRTDQLGDMVASIPAMIRLREIAPEAVIVGVVTSANADLARTLDIFDDIIVIDFPDDPLERRRIMPLRQQKLLREKLHSYRFDLAIDFAQSHVSRDLLLLSGAAIKFGVHGSDWPWLDGSLTFETPDRWSGRDNAPHATKVLTLVEAVGTLVQTRAPVIRRNDLHIRMLAPYGIDENDRFAVLHMGARINFSRWPGFIGLAEMLIARTDLKVILMTDDPDVRTSLPASLRTPRLQLVDRRLAFDMFDAFLSFATVVVGNDSGPKHLAALRGTNVVTLFTARINWQEWGQENIGSVISRRVPCAGCAIFHDSEDCGKNFSCIRDIRVEEVFGEMSKYI